MQSRSFSLVLAVSGTIFLLQTLTFASNGAGTTATRIACDVNLDDGARRLDAPDEDQVYEAHIRFHSQERTQAVDASPVASILDGVTELEQEGLIRTPHEAAQSMLASVQPLLDSGLFYEAIAEELIARGFEKKENFLTEAARFRSSYQDAQKREFIHQVVLNILNRSNENYSEAAELMWEALSRSNYRTLKIVLLDQLQTFDPSFQEGLIKKGFRAYKGLTSYFRRSRPLRQRLQGSLAAVDLSSYLGGMNSRQLNYFLGVHLSELSSAQLQLLQQPTLWRAIAPELQAAASQRRQGLEEIEGLTYRINELRRSQSDDQFDPRLATDLDEVHAELQVLGKEGYTTPELETLYKARNRLDDLIDFERVRTARDTTSHPPSESEIRSRLDAVDDSYVANPERVVETFRRALASSVATLNDSMFEDLTLSLIKRSFYFEDAEFIIRTFLLVSRSTQLRQTPPSLLRRLKSEMVNMTVHFVLPSETQEVIRLTEQDWTTSAPAAEGLLESLLAVRIRTEEQVTHAERDEAPLIAERQRRLEQRVLEIEGRIAESRRQAQLQRQAQLAEAEAALQAAQQRHGMSPRL